MTITNRLRFGGNAANDEVSLLAPENHDDGDYPPVRSEWLGQAEDFPNVLIKAHHETLVASPYRAVHWQIPEECAESVAATLREWGYLVERTDFLEFC